MTDQTRARRASLPGSACLAALVLTALTLCALFCSRPAQAADWMTPYLEQVQEWGVMRGDANGNLHEDRNINRAEFVTLVNRAFGYKEVGPHTFADVNPNDWFAEDISIAHQAGYFNGTSANTASPYALVTREQAAVMMVRVHDLLNARSTHITSLNGRQTVSVPTPEPKPGEELPTTPLEPLTDLYDLLRRMKLSGADMGQAVLRLAEGGVRTVIANGTVVSRDTLNAQEVAELLGRPGVNEYYSTRYESAYCIYQPNEGQTAAVWYQSAQSLSAKLQLARLFGVTQYILE